METKGLRAKRFPYPAPWGGTFLIPASELEILEIKENLGIELPYFLLVGSRMSLKGYKNAILFLRH